MSRIGHLVCCIIGLALLTAVLMLATHLPGCSATGDLNILKLEFRHEVTAASQPAADDRGPTVEDLVREGLR